MAATKKTNRLDLLRQVKASLSRHLAARARLRVALSGGVDSVVLLSVLADIAPLFPFELSALHVHHGLNPKADEWAAHCLSLCKRMNIPCEIVYVNVSRESDEGLEAAARKARYAVLTKPGVDVLALAHHLDDQAETVLLQLLRGGEPRALAAMPEARRESGMLLLRPLLNVHKSALLDYAKAHQLAWVEDDSNLDTALSRNALRREVLPVLEKHFPDYRQRLSAAARRMAEIAETLDSQAQSVMHGDGLSVTVLSDLPQPEGINLLAAFLRRQCPSMPRPGALRELYRQLIHANGRLMLPLPSGYRLMREEGQLRVSKPENGRT